MSEMFVRMSAERDAKAEDSCWHRRNPASIHPATAVTKTFCGKNVSTFLHRTYDVRDVRNQDIHCGTCFPIDMEEIVEDPNGKWHAMEPYTGPVPDGVKLVGPEKELDVDVEIEMLLPKLSREQLRRLAWEALMRADGPFCTFADINSDFYQDAGNSMFSVVVKEQVVRNMPTGFMLLGKRGWET